MVRFAFLLILPLEKHIQNKYFDKAVKKLDECKNLVKIGITGSYGKTSVKNIMATILSESYNVVKSPFSYNTPMGLAKSVNDITDDTQIFIMEIG
ncbi:MAG TPA: Mur ligase family protein, partial [Clostridia bacterium]|nr:Mur ligase family protein [Clostridia bacterium]